MKWFGRAGSRLPRRAGCSYSKWRVTGERRARHASDEARQAALRTFGNALAVRKARRGAPAPLLANIVSGYPVRGAAAEAQPGPHRNGRAYARLGHRSQCGDLQPGRGSPAAHAAGARPALAGHRARAHRQGSRDSFSHTDYEWLRDHNRAFSGLAASTIWKLNLDAGDHKERVTAELVSGNYFSLLGVEPVGRPHDRKSKTSGRAALSRSSAMHIWQRAFGGRDDALGRNCA